MDCPKCGFSSPGDGGGFPVMDSCPKCGVVFKKAAAAAAAGGRRPALSAPPRPAGGETAGRGPSVVNILLLSVLLSATGGLLWQKYRSSEPPVTDDAGRPVDSGAGVGGREILVEVPPPPEPLTLVIPGLEPSVPDSVEAPAADSAREVPKLPALSESSVSLALIDHAREVSREFPEETSIRSYVAAAYLLLAGKEIRSRRWKDALGYVDEAESWGVATHQAAAFRAVIFGEQESWELAEKWARTALSYGARDNAASMHHLIGKAHYFREELTKAIEEFRKALALRDDPAIRASLELALRDSRASAGFDQRRLSHFIVRYEGETMEDTGRMVIDTMERSYATLVSQLGFEPPEPVVVLLYSRRSYREMGGPHWSAGFFDGKIRVPVQGLTALDEHLRSTLHHELAHAFVHARAGRAAPRWLHEGIAEYMEGARGADHGTLLARVLNDGNSFEHCLSKTECDVRVFYPAATSLVDYMIQNRGMGGVRDVLQGLGEGEDIDGALRKVMGREESELIREWQHFVKRRFS